MVIGVPKEIKNNEYRVALTPGGRTRWQGAGHRVLVERSAGVGSGIADGEYERPARNARRQKEVFDAGGHHREGEGAAEPEYGLFGKGRRSIPTCTWRRTRSSPRRCSRQK